MLDFSELQNQTLLGHAVSLAVRAGLLRRLMKPASAEELIADSSLSPHLVKSLLHVLTEAGVLVENGGTYTAGAETRLAFGPEARGEFEVGFGHVLSEVQRSHALLFYRGDLKFGRRWRRPWRKFKFYRNPTVVDDFVRYASPAAEQAGRDLATQFDFAPFREVIDVGGNDGAFLAQILKRHPRLMGQVVDLAAVEPLARARFERMGLCDRLSFRAADFFYDPLPASSLFTCGFVLHDWPDHFSALILKNIHRALPPGGRLILHENILDDPRRELRRAHAFFHFALTARSETRAGAAGEKTVSDYASWLGQFGFQLDSVQLGRQKAFLLFTRL